MREQPKTKKKTFSEKKRDLFDFAKYSFGIFLCIGVFVIVFSEIQDSILLDFEIYYYAGQALLNRESPYQLYGDFFLPFQYFPWVGWLFIPLALIPMPIAWFVYAFINLILLFFSIYILLRIPPTTYNKLRILFIFSASLMMCLLVFVVGQISIFILFVYTLTIKLLYDNKSKLAGLLFPLLITKPHLMLIFLPYILLKGGKKFLIFSGLGTIFLMVTATIQNHDWMNEMLNIIRTGQSRSDDLLWGFSTLPGALELSNWRIMNFVFALPSLIVSILILKKAEKLPFTSQAPFALALSLFSAPYSFAYDFPLLIPALIHLSNTYKVYIVLIWLFAAIFPFILQFQGQTYILVLLIVILIVFEVKTITRKSE